LGGMLGHLEEECPPGRSSSGQFATIHGVIPQFRSHRFCGTLRIMCGPVRGGGTTNSFPDSRTWMAEVLSWAQDVRERSTELPSCSRQGVVRVNRNVTEIQLFEAWSR